MGANLLTRRRYTPRSYGRPPVEDTNTFGHAVAAAEGRPATHQVVVTAMGADRVDGRSQLSWAVAHYGGTQQGNRLEVCVPQSIADWFERNLLVKTYLPGHGLNITDDTVTIAAL